MIFGGIGLGTFPLSGAFTEVDEVRSVEILDNYFRGGGVYLDTAPTYAFGRVESLLGAYLSGQPRSSFAVSTSCGYVRDGSGFRVSGRPDDVRRDIEESLARLDLDHVDVYISHIPDLDTPLEQTAAALQQLKEEGLARTIGVSNVSASQLLRYASAAEIGVVQNRLSFLNRTVDSAFERALSDSGASMVAYQVVERGMLTATGPTLGTSGDLRLQKPEFEESRRAWVRIAVNDLLAPIAERADRTVESLAVGWTLSQPYVGLAQIGATRPEQAAALPRMATPLSPDVLAQLESAFKELSDQLERSDLGSVREFLGLASYDVRSGSASGK